MGQEGQVNVADRLRATAERLPERPAIRWQDRELSYRELDAAVDAGAAALQHLGIDHGDRVVLVLGNVPAFAEAYYAVLRSGAVAVPLNLGSTADELRYVLADCGARAAIVAASQAPVVTALRDELPDLEVVVVVGAQPEGLAELPRWRELLDGSGAPEAAGTGGDDLAALVYTSGTTGRPKGAMLTHTNLDANQAQSLAGRFEVSADDTILLVLPLFHIYALNVGLGVSLRVGATVALSERFDPVGTLELIEREAVTIVLGAPPMYVAWLAASEGDEDGRFGSVRLAVSGAAPLPVQILRRFADTFGITIEEGYGLTEAGPSVTSNAMAPAGRPSSVGLPLPEVDLRLVDDDGHEVAQGDPGEVWVRGPNVFAGYWDDPAATATALTDDGWLRTGDVGTQDDEGFLYLVDRKKDLVIVSGFNVYPREVERTLYQHEGVSEAAVVGVPHPYTGEAVKAFVVPRADAELSVDEVVEFCRRYLARYKCPETVEFVASLPHTATGKVRRVELRDRD